MEYRSILTAAVAVASFVAPATAHAATYAEDSAAINAAVSISVPAANVHADAMLRTVVSIADAYWRSSGHPMRCVADIRVYDDPFEDVAARADLNGCKIYFDRSWRDKAWTTYTDKNMSLTARRGALIEVCGYGIHEDGHRLGLPDFPGTGNIMDPNAGARPVINVCQQWAAAMLPQARSALRTRSARIRTRKTRRHRHTHRPQNRRTFNNEG